MKFQVIKCTITQIINSGEYHETKTLLDWMINKSSVYTYNLNSFVLFFIFLKTTDEYSTSI